MSDLKFFIRPANNLDIPSIKKVVFTSLMEYGLIPDEFGKDNDLNDIEKNYFERNGFFGVLIEADSSQVIGTFGLFPARYPVCELRKMYLSKPFRGQGLGKVLMEAAIKHATDMHFQKLILETVSPLKEAIALYKSYGFIEITPAIINKRVDQAYELNLQNPISR
jgi:GNAT superfamily N-acetyltransferase